ncbi:MAG: M20 family metallopeptidase [Firmicutes bacterium]|nr:M20 family metallopeptidase [Bacillota bacterium]
MDWKAKVKAEVEAKSPILKQLALEIGEHPELGFDEHNASRLLQAALKKGGYEVEAGLAGLKTAFRGRLGVPGKPNAALLCEYDALPEIGHACGHNLIGAASVGAALGLAPFLQELGGQLTVLGTPGEETGAGKALLVKAGVFEEVDAALMFHPSSQNILISTSNALDAYEFIFRGKPAHAADSPEEGINALDGVIQFFNGLNALRQHLDERIRFHGIITEGGQAPNIVPDKAVARFYLRAPRRDLLDALLEKVLAAARGAALTTGSAVYWRQFEPSNDNLVTNRALALAFGANLQELGVAEIEEYAEGKGSSDMGNVSHVVPAIHPYLSIGAGLTAHTPQFAEASLSPAGIKTAVVAAQALAMTVVDLFTNPSLLEAVQKEFEER